MSRDATCLLIVGASARAAAFSARRAGLRPWCADLFADADLAALCPVVRVAAADYPDAFVKLARQAPPGPWLYTGGLENRFELVERLARRRPLWGNGAAVLRRVRRPEQVAEVLRSAGLPVPAVCRRPDELPARGRWLIKPLAGSGGSGIRFFRRGGPRPRRPVYFQQFIDGQPLSAVYVAGADQTRLLGVTRQLVGQHWLHAQPFHYCGSVGPVPLARRTRETFVRIGAVLSSAFGLRGLFGVDCLLRDGIPWTIEVNPRYPASVEVLELACGVPALALHRRVFEPHSPPIAGGNGRRDRVVGKAICFAQATFTFPAEGPWAGLRHSPPDPWERPHFADVPPAGEVIRAGRPILTFFAAADSVARCLAELKRQAKDLNRTFARRWTGN